MNLSTVRKIRLGFRLAEVMVDAHRHGLDWEQIERYAAAWLRLGRNWRRRRSPRKCS